MITTQMRELKSVNDKWLTDPAFENLRKPGIRQVPGRGPFNPRIMLVGDSPGKVENESTVPFQGNSGEHLYKILREMDIDARQVYYTNVFKFWPQSSEDPNKTRELTDDEFEAARHLLHDEVFAVNPDIVGLLGRSALRAVFPYIKEVHRVHGQLLDGIYVPLFHPAALKYVPNRIDSVKEGFYKMLEYLEAMEKSK